MSGRTPSVTRLSVRLARIACDLDDVRQELAAGPLTIEDEDLLAPTAGHLALVYESIADTLYTLEKWGRSPWPAEARARARGNGKLTHDDIAPLLQAEQRDMAT